MFNIALTGGIASGKSTVESFFSDKGILVTDSDNIAKQLVIPGSSALNKIAFHFGNTILNADHSLNREVLGSIIFSNETERKWLEKLLHPLIFQTIFQILNSNSSPYSITSIPLLVETKNQYKFDHILCVETDLETQIKRLKQRNKLSREEAILRINSQADESDRKNIADDIIINLYDTPLDQLRKNVDSLHTKFLSLSKNASS